MCAFCSGEEYKGYILASGDSIRVWTSPHAHKTIFFTEYSNGCATREYALTMNYCPFCGRKLSIADKHVALNS